MIYRTVDLGGVNPETARLEITGGKEQILKLLQVVAGAINELKIEGAAVSQIAKQAPCRGCGDAQ